MPPKIPKPDSAGQLYHAIRKRVKRTMFPRRLIDSDEIINEIFVRLSCRDLPTFGSAEFENLLRRMTHHVVRDYKRFSKPATDIDALDHDEHPYYTVEFHSGEENFETVFSQFCDSFTGTKRTVFQYSRVLPKKNIAELTGLHRDEVTRIIKSMPDEFEKFYRNFSEGSSPCQKI